MNDKWLKFEVFVKDGKFLEDLHTLLQKYNMYPQYLAVHTPGKQTSACCPSCEAYRPVKVEKAIKEQRFCERCNECLS